MCVRGYFKFFFFSLLGLLLVTTPVFAAETVEAKLSYGKYESMSQCLAVDKPTILQIQVKNGENSAGDLYYKVCQRKQFIDDEDNNKVVSYSDTVLRGCLPFTTDGNGGQKEQEVSVQPGKYYIELSTCLEMFPLFDTPTCEGEAVLRVK